MNICLLPERTGWTLLMTTQKANKGVRSLTRSFTSVSFENREGYASRKMIKTRASKSPIRIEVTTATTRENLAVLGWKAPSSFDTLTLFHWTFGKINQLFIIDYIIIFRLCDIIILIDMFKFELSTLCCEEANLTATFIPKDTMMVQPNIFMLQITK